jgi:hypothetical protein
MATGAYSIPIVPECFVDAGLAIEKSGAGRLKPLESLHRGDVITMLDTS